MPHPCLANTELLGALGRLRGFVARELVTLQTKQEALELETANHEIASGHLAGQVETYQAVLAQIDQEQQKALYPNGAVVDASTAIVLGERRS